MKDGKAEVVKTEILKNGDMLVKLASSKDRDRFLVVVKALAPKGAAFRLVGDTDLLCMVFADKSEGNLNAGAKE